jgi:hypothetical protein
MEVGSPLRQCWISTWEEQEEKYQGHTAWEWKCNAFRMRYGMG